MTLSGRQVTSVLSEEAYRKLDRTFLLPEHGTKQIEPNIVHWDYDQRNGKRVKQIKFLLLPQVISEGAWLKAHCAAMYDARPKKGTRAGDGQVYGKKLTLGWIKLRYPGYDNMRTAPTLEQPKLLAALYPLLMDMDQLIADNLPDYHNFAFGRAMQAMRPDAEEDDLDRIADPHGHAVVKNLDPWQMTYTIRGTIFSTVEFNKNIVFKAHEDGHNVEGTCVGITTLGFYAGGRLVFPRYGYSAELRPRDLLICDNNHEMHGNLGPIVGDRYSVVAFLHDSVMGRAPLADI